MCYCIIIVSLQFNMILEFEDDWIGGRRRSAAKLAQSMSFDLEI